MLTIQNEDTALKVESKKERKITAIDVDFTLHLGHIRNYIKTRKHEPISIYQDMELRT